MLVSFIYWNLVMSGVSCIRSDDIVSSTAWMFLVLDDPWNILTGDVSQSDLLQAFKAVKQLKPKASPQSSVPNQVLREDSKQIPIAKATGHGSDSQSQHTPHI